MNSLRPICKLVSCLALTATVAVAGQPERVWVVVHPPDLAAPAAQWADYRRGRGCDVQDVDTGLLAPVDASAAALARAIQVELRRRFAAAREGGVAAEDFAVVLLGPVADGDGQPAIPTWYRPQTDPDLIGRDGLADIATDLNYQLADDDDDVPDFPLGRIPARTPAEALAALDKVQRYETAAPPGPWRRRITYLAGQGGFGAALDRLLERLFIRMVDQVVPYDFDVSMTYANERSPYCAPPDRFGQVVLDRLSEGALLVNYLGHGQVGMLDRFTVGGERYDVCSVQSLAGLRDSGNRLPIALLIACWTGRFDLPPDRRGLGEAMLFNRNGPVAIVAATRITHPFANALVQKALTEQISANKRPTIGGAHLAAMRSLAQPDEMDLQLEAMAIPVALAMNWATSPADLRLMHMSMYGLLGDPALRTAYPPDSIAHLAFDRASGQVSGTVVGAAEGEALITIESSREVIPRLGEMRLLSGVGGVGGEALDEAFTHNYELANDKVLWRGVVAIESGGRFEMMLPRDVLDRSTAAWIKVYVTATDERGGASDACGSIPIRSSAAVEADAAPNEAISAPDKPTASPNDAGAIDR